MQDSMETRHQRNQYPAHSLSRNYFFSSTILTASAAWVVAFAAQIAVTKSVRLQSFIHIHLITTPGAFQDGHQAVGVMWFAVFLQLLLIIGVTAILLRDEPSTYRLQICLFSSMASIFAVFGVDMSIFAAQPARRAMAAGWLILAVIDLMWTICFSAEPHTPFARLVDSMTIGSRNAHTDSQVEDKERQASNAGRTPSNRVSSGKFIESELLPSPDQAKAAPDQRQNGHPSPEISANWTPMGRHRIVESLEDLTATMDLEGGVARPDSVTVTPRTHSFPPPPVAAKNRRAVVYVEEPRHLSTIYDQTERGTSEARTGSQRDSEELYPFRVRAKGDWIPRSPSEISFKKGDILHSAEKDGKKWWNVRKVDGAVGCEFIILLTSSNGLT
ncbi:SH3-domain-containing membrane protein [Favolaschia claudopus]|uniref:SH3-domain-containing membrane protein n=1 Tax=Favolaschia claudopus TaxID=2862362 RepID=A0AAW0DF77_9AGAR